MFRINSIVVLVGICVVSLFGQKPIARQAAAFFSNQKFETVSLFHDAKEMNADFSSYLKEGQELDLNKEKLNALLESQPTLFRLELPQPFNIDLDLYRVNPFEPNATLTTSDGIKQSVNHQSLYYRGIISDNAHSIAIVSVFGSHIQIVFANEDGNRRIQPTPEGKYISFRDSDLLIEKSFDCFTEDDEDYLPELPSESREQSGNCIQVYIECDYKSYQDNGSSIVQTEAWVGALWNEVIALYENEEIPVSVSDIHVYTSPDPFAGFTSTSTVLTAFRAHIDTLTYNGRLAHLLSTRPLGGGIAYVNVLCSESYQCAFSSSLTTLIVPVPTYSWNVECVTHEMGHNLGSQHTHACVWNGNNTQIDDCGNVYYANNGLTPEGSACFNPNSPIIPTNGTIMSYCHLIGGVGINFNLGFGTLPGNLIRNKYNTAGCNTGTCSPPECTSITIPVTGSNNADINTDITWSASPGALGYYLTIGTSPTNGSVLNNVDVGFITSYDLSTALAYNTLYYVKVIPYNSLGNAIGCVNQTFTTENNIIPSCTQVYFPSNGSNNISVTTLVKWNHSVGNQTGYRISIGTTSGGTQIVNDLDVGNVTSYDHPTEFPFGTTLYVRITPYNTNGYITNCATQNFTTLVPVAGDFCTNAITLPCGSSVAGSTVNAMVENNLPFCVTPVEAPGMWYTFIGDGKNVIIQTCSGTNYDTKLNAYSGSCSELICVTGNDDFCNTGSTITFATTNGTQYFILVQGWDGETGNYNITRSCYTGPLYCVAQSLSSTMEWISQVQVGSFIKNSGASNYSNFTSDTITLSRGGSYSIQLTPGYLQGSRPEFFRVYMDHNQDGDFSDSNEQLYSSPQAVYGASAASITIPISAATGNTRMRVLMRYNNLPEACNAFNMGEVEDYTVRVKCNIVNTFSDSGNGSLRNVSFCVDDGEEVLFAPSLNNGTIVLSSGPIEVDGNWKWMADQNSNITIKTSSGLSRILSVPTGKSIEIQNLTLLGGNSTTGSIIDNSGSTIFRNCKLKRATGNTGHSIRNRNQMIFQGSIQIED